MFRESGVKTPHYVIHRFYAVTDDDEVKIISRILLDDSGDASAIDERHELGIQMRQSDLTSLVRQSNAF